MTNLTLHGAGHRRMSAAQLRELRRQMRLAQRKLEEMQDVIQTQELMEDIDAEQKLEQELQLITTE